LAQEPELLLLDEPTSSLDWQGQREILNSIDALRKEYGLTIFMASHDLNAVSTLADKVAMLKDGTLMAHGDLSTVLTESNLTTLFDVPIKLAEVDGRQTAIF
jgi:iron complex transport system ATP-binding protein